MTTRTARDLGVYVLPGPAMKPKQTIIQTKEAERIGLGSAWMSELQGPLKDAGALCGYMGAHTSTIAVGTSITHFGTRHPIVQASWALTMQEMTDGRFMFGFGRSSAERWRAWGIRPPTLQSMEDHAMILRRLWAHESFSYSGPAGDFPVLQFDGMGSDFPDVAPPPLMLAANGPKTLDLVGRCFDAAMLYPFLTPEAVARCRVIVRDAAEKAGRNPDDVKIQHQMVVAPDMDEEGVTEAVYRRAAAYLVRASPQETIFTTNQWDPSRLDEFRAAAAADIAANLAAGSPLKNRDVLTRSSRLLPPEIAAEGAAIGTASECAHRIHDFFDAGADEIVLHGVTAEFLEPTVRAFESANR